MAARIVGLEARVFGLEETIVGLEERIGGLLAMIERLDTKVEKPPMPDAYSSNDELAVIRAARRATAQTTKAMTKDKQYHRLGKVGPGDDQAPGERRGRAAGKP